MTTKKEPANNIAPARHSTVVGGSTAKRVMACPASVELCRTAPKLPTSDYAREGSMLHEAIAAVIGDNLDPVEMIGYEYDGLTLTEELYEEKLLPAVRAFDKYIDALEDTTGETATIMVEQEVNFGKYLPDAFGSCDVLVRVGDRVCVIDWKFGRVAVSAEENSQLMFYASAAARTEGTKLLFEDAVDVDLVIIQPPSEADIWETTLPRLTKFERELKAAVKAAKGKNPRLKAGDHCRWCAAKGAMLCPLMNGALERAEKTDITTLDTEKLGRAYKQSFILEQFIKDLRQMIELALEQGVEVPGCKLVAKRATRKWKNEEEAAVALSEYLSEEEAYKRDLISPAQAEKLYKKLKVGLPEELIEKVSSGNTLAPEDDPRPAVQTEANLVKALNKIN